jgi:hypothetical protein
MGRSIWATRGILPGTVIEPAGELVHPLVQSTTERDIQFLDPAADRQDWQVAPDRLADQRERRRIAIRVMQNLRVTRFAAILTGVDIRRAPGQ